MICPTVKHNFCFIEKYLSSVIRKMMIYCAHPAPARGTYRDRHDTWGGLQWTDRIVRRAMSVRAAKACGPGAPGLALSVRVGDVGPSGPTRRTRRRR